MFLLLCARRLNQVRSAGDFTNHIHLDFIQNPFLKRFSTSIDGRSFTVSYLINSCGLSKEAAVSASKWVQFESSDKPDSVLSFLRSYEFTDTQISRIIRNRPMLLILDLEKILKPKFAFLYSVGFSPPDLAKIICSDSSILTFSLKNQIMPSFEYLKGIVHTNDNVVTVLKRLKWAFRSCHWKHMDHNIATLRDYGVPERFILSVIRSQPQSLTRPPDLFNKSVKEIKDLGFDPSKSVFARTVSIITLNKKSTIERKLDIFKKFGCSEREIISMIKKHPFCLVLSEKKILRGMDFLMNKMGLEPSFIANNPILICFSLEKRIIPWYSVIQVLLSKGLINKDINVVQALRLSTRGFMEKFVIRYQKEIPQLMKIYEGEMDCLELINRSEEMDN
ncbi:PREDICTED: transcription termination factor MTERF15, mitochondrial-like [Nelumbo nucifera]|uniref:Transcription termination factor MTERF15, mitochondrial-like n=1 Tax=Nelumbo nucifera TaxID=4432 RepID=A0A1U7YN41_NELNU|nr:PREDICTED: transcription termination factor MTERF15, mitochondrial-like [Nelumbo nucifera]XP_019056151.1 PREDICTED: transcription termination factor MTERF15, mitochondrial-like [Nelumbo nucifera]XP_019056152.1 PREDICTED: transcription termination factor MTERF15, mitochondrial-like [Nelumbo nucifera]